MCLCLCLCLCLCMYISFSLSSLGDIWCCPLPQHIGKFPDLRRMFYGGRINGDNHTTNQSTADRVNIEQSARYFATTWKKTRFKTMKTNAGCHQLLITIVTIGEQRSCPPINTQSNMSRVRDDNGWKMIRHNCKLPSKCQMGLTAQRVYLCCHFDLNWFDLNK